jgi:hypothetical protein
MTRERHRSLKFVEILVFTQRFFLRTPKLGLRLRLYNKNTAITIRAIATIRTTIRLFFLESSLWKASLYCTYILFFCFVQNRLF